MNNSVFDTAIIGGGIVGLSTALTLQQRFPSAKIVLLEKEHSIAQHQTGHNSGVIHAGVYYQPGSLKADFCKRGHSATIEFCKTHAIPFRQCGKLIVATSALEVERLKALEQRCEQNGIEVTALNAAELNAIEPAVSGLAALRVEQSGIVGYKAICEKLAELFTSAGGTILLGRQLLGVEEQSNHSSLITTSGSVNTRFSVVCGGLMADRLCKLFGIDPDFGIVPFRGEYYQLPATKNSIVEHMIYPVPNPALPFLGIHLTPMIDGSITVGPNALLGWKREGYGKVNLNWRDSWDNIRTPGFLSLLYRYRMTGLKELGDSFFKKRYLKTVQRYCPAIEISDLQPYPAGVRAQAINSNGELIHDFLFAESARSLHVCNAPSPAATSALPIGAYIVDKVADRMPPLNM